MRDIKFRAWNNAISEFVSNDTMLDGAVTFDGKLKLIYGLDVVSYIIGQYQLEQYTGLKDKNGVEIYENDIVKTSGSNIYVVEFFDGKFNPVSELEGSNWEVIGNIHEHPELLEEQS